MRAKKSWPIHPFLFSLFPPLFLFRQNLDAVPISMLLLPVGVILAVTGLLFILGSLFFRQRYAAALFASLCIALFFLYGRFYQTILGWSLGGVFLGRHRFMIPFWVAIFFIGCMLLWRFRKRLVRVTLFLNATSAFLIILNAIPISTWASTRAHEEHSLSGLVGARSLPDPQKPPDIYYLVLDGYGGSEMLRQLYGFDNESFLEFLQSRGFRIARQSRSNYTQTHLSLASSLNMAYLRSPSKPSKRRVYGLHDAEGVFSIFGLIQRNRVARSLKQLGYRFIHISSTWDSTAGNVYADLDFRPNSLDEFTRALLHNTALTAFTFQSRFIQVDAQKSVLYQLKVLEESVLIPGPKFTFAHIVCPHPPYVFTRNGQIPEITYSPSNPWQPKSAYIDQMLFLNGRLKQLLEVLLAHSATPPVIVLQGDHGPAATWPDRELSIEAYAQEQLNERTSILNAYYLPGKAGLLYDSISPVNTFRLIFNAYFGTSYPLLPDISYVSTYKHPRQYKVFQN